MTPGETAAAARRLDAFLHEAARKTRMTEIGGRRLAGSFKALLAGAKAEIEAAHTDLAGAIGEVSEQAKAAKQAAQQIRLEAAEMRTAIGEVLGNNPPEEEPGSGGDTGRG